MIFVDGLVSNNALLQLLSLDFWIPGLQSLTPRKEVEKKRNKLKKSTI